MESGRGKLIIVSGPSGAGKSTVVDRLVADPELPFVRSVSATTRPARRGEVDGADYHFLSRDEFSRRREADEFLECTEVFGRGDWYGTLRSEVTTGLEAGKWVVLEIDVRGASEVLRQYPSAVTIFLHPGSLDELERRLRGRATETEQSIRRRLAVARSEMAWIDRYRHEIVNDDIDSAVERIRNVLVNPGD